jgi:hypothetical protein
MKKTILTGAIALVMLNSCGVQQFQVNSETKDFENGGRVFGEKTKELKKDKDYSKSGTFFIIGINAMNDAKTQEMAKKINADKYTIETKNNLLSVLISGISNGIFQYKVVKVIKRNK